jgi:putative peptide zinc metalloprotease protein
VSRKFGRNVSANSVRFLVEKKLHPMGVLAPTDGADIKLERANPPLALKFCVPILPERLVRAVAGVLWPLFLPPVIVAMLGGLVALYFWMFFIHGMSQSVTEPLYQPGLFLMLFGLALLSGLFHEFGHATACHYGGAKPSRIGVGIYVVWPVFYNDVTDTYRLGRGGRLRTDLGGIYFNVIYSLVIVGVYFLTGFEPLLLVIFLEQVMILEQFMPFIRLDGYYMVSDLTGVPDLFAYIKPILKSLVPGREADGRVRELKSWVHMVVSVWVATAIPVLLCLFTMLLISAPLVFTTVLDSFFIHYDELWEAFADGKVV